MFELIGLIPAIPFLGFLINGIFGKKIHNEKVIGTIASLAVAIPFVILLILFFKVASMENFLPVVQHIFTWFSFGSFEVSVAYQLDQLSILFSLITSSESSIKSFYRLYEWR